MVILLVPVDVVSAPRVCGDDPTVASAAYLAPDVLPAYAGMILRGCLDVCRKRGAPRVCGDDPAVEVECYASAPVLPAYAGMIPVFRTSRALRAWCSPRMRG